MPEMPTDTSANVSQPQPEHDWEMTEAVPETTPWDYGYVINGFSIGCTKEELIKAVIKRGSELKFVWTPEAPEPVRPERIVFLTAAFKKRASNGALQSIALGAALVAFGIVLAFAFNDWNYLYRNFLVVIGAAVLVEGTWRLYRTRTFALEDALSEASGARFDNWSEAKSIGGYTFGLGACLVVVGVAQMLAGIEESIAAAGLVKPSVWQGQVWRLATASFDARKLHALLDELSWATGSGKNYRANNPSGFCPSGLSNLGDMRKSV